MQIFENANLLSKEISKLKLSGKTIGLVPTMGNLHQGHLHLVEKAKQQCDFVIATIFVNPMQFGPNEDFDRYPKTIEKDKLALVSNACDALFTPSVDEMYPAGLGKQTVISVPELSALHCGKSRPGHFDGVCTVVNKLLNLNSPDIAFFGTKDYQQLLIIKKMVTDLCMPISIVGVATQRDNQGLALSSRNSYLSEDEKNTAKQLYQTLKNAKSQLSSSSFPDIEENAKRELDKLGMKIDYFTICNARTLKPATRQDAQIVILAAVYLGSTRLIDNIEFSVNKANKCPP